MRGPAARFFASLYKLLAITIEQITASIPDRSAIQTALAEVKSAYAALTTPQDGKPACLTPPQSPSPTPA